MTIFDTTRLTLVKCIHCGRRGRPNILNTAPRGWHVLRDPGGIRDPRGNRFICPRCRDNYTHALSHRGSR